MSFDPKSIELFQKRVTDYEGFFGRINKQSRSKDWQPARFAVRDHIIALVDSRHESKENIILVDVFLTEDPEWLKGFSGTKLAILYLLSEAYQCGSSMGIKFTTDVEGGTIPTSIIDLAETIGVELKYVSQGFITPKESRFLYLTLTEFSTAAVKRIKELSVTNTITPERICYLVNHGIWSKDEMELILLGYNRPELVLNGTIDIIDYLTYFQILSISRSALLTSFLDRKLRQKEIIENGQAIDIEASDRKFTTSFNSDFFAKIYLTTEETPIPWTNNQELSILPNQRLVVAIRDYDWTDFLLNFDRDCNVWRDLISIFQDSTPTHFFLLLPQSVLDIPESIDLDPYLNQLNSIGITPIICPEALVALDNEALKHLQKMPYIRHDVDTGPASSRPGLIISHLPSRYNSPELKVVAIPHDTHEDLINLPLLVEQHLYDIPELVSKVNRINVENRFHRTLDKISYLGKVFALNNSKATTTFSTNFLDELTSLGLTQAVYSPKRLDQVICLIQQHSTSPYFQKLIDYLEIARDNQLTVIFFLDMHSTDIQPVNKNSISEEDLENSFRGQFVFDRIIDYTGKNAHEIAESLIWAGVNQAKVGRANAVNLNEVPNSVLTQVLNTFLYRQIRDSQFPVSINIVYTDGSKARPFPIGQLTRRSPEEMASIRQLIPIKIGMMSCRHADMDSKIDRYWLRNIDVNRCGRSSAEKDEFAYQTTKERLDLIDKNRQPTRLEFYQTGFEPIIIGFYRAIAEFLIDNKNQSPLLEIIPRYFDYMHPLNYLNGTPWF